ncbi:MAG TPA: AbrB/MazE/SpoVT family DNA-binding domain-containing protein [Candidatus Angelobacter sp.]|jgi:AbrB family looped-hinge helix DNA binding protein|nr:AbrB/MazE/SpoVT family DNA-binding domain-containing protein [Candidatus Angelobacter sp.]
MESAISVKGQATIPKVVREYLGLKPGDRIKFFYIPTAASLYSQNFQRWPCEAS